MSTVLGSPAKTGPATSERGICYAERFTHMIDDETLKQLLQIDDELMQLCKWLNEKRDIEVSSRLIPLLDDLTHILIEAGRRRIV
jgi:hypothetical protein